MLRNKNTTIISEVKDFFTSSEKVINTILTILSFLTLSEKQVGLEDKSNNRIKNINKVFLLILFPFFEIKDVWHYQHSSLYPILRHGKDIFYRLLNNSMINWRKISYHLSKQIIDKAQRNKVNTEPDAQHPRCLIIDDTDYPRQGGR